MELLFLIHCLLLVAASPIWSLLFNCYPPLLVFGLCCLVISILLTGYFSLLLAICHVVAYFQNVRFTHCIALLLCWPLLLALLVLFRCKEARSHTGAAQNMITEMLCTLKTGVTFEAAPMKKCFFRACHILICGILVTVFRLWMPTLVCCILAYTCIWLLARQAKAVHDIDCRVSTSISFAVACIPILENNIQHLAILVTIVLILPRWGLWWPRAPPSGFTKESVHWWYANDAVSPQNPTSWKLIGHACKLSTEDAGDGRQRIQQLSGQLFQKIDTDGDGACAIHSVFGAPSIELSNRLFVQNARARAIATLGDTASEFRRRLEGSSFYESICTALWGDLLLPILYASAHEPTPLIVRSQGKILWNCIERDGALSDLLRRHVKTELEKRRNADAIKAEAKQRFNTLCRKDYDGLWAMVTAQMNEAAVVWNPEAMPVDSNGFVKGTRTKMPSRDPPLTMHEALLDQRAVFNQIRYGYIECQGGDLLDFQRPFLHVLNHLQPELSERQEIRDFVIAIARVVENTNAHSDVSPPANFMDLVWPHYLHAYLHGGLGRDYWLSYDELLALATIAKVNLVIVQEQAGCFHYVGDNLACVADPEQRVVLSSVRGGGTEAIESHFERLMPIGEQALQTLSDRSSAQRLRAERTAKEEESLSQQAAKELELERDG